MEYLFNCETGFSVLIKYMVTFIHIFIKLNVFCRLIGGLRPENVYSVHLPYI